MQLVKHAGAGAPSRSVAEPCAGAVLCVDLDGTLVRTDTLWEACLAMVRAGFQWLLIPLWLLGGKAAFKRRVAASSPLDVSTLPYNEPLIEQLKQRAAAGQPLVLCTGADETIARKVADHLGIFSEVMASDGVRNLTGRRKQKALEERYGAAGYEYVGNSGTDLPVWRASAVAHLVDAPARLERTLKRQSVPVGIVLPKHLPGTWLSRWIRAIRVHQWSKNLLLFVPLALGHKPYLLPAVLGFLAFGLTASSAYLLNDIIDLAADRRHAHKRTRAFASGAIPITAAFVAIPLLLLTAAGIALLLPFEFALILGLYLCATLAYSFDLKQRAVVDVIMLAGLYTIRIAAGGAATGIVISPWTYAMSVFLFLSLALVKRVSELRASHAADHVYLPGRSYRREDIQQLASMGGSAGYISVLVTALYIHSADVQLMYSHPQRLWFLLPIMLYWISRLWLYTNRGWINQDPIVFAIKDRMTYILGFFAAIIGALAV